MKRRAFMTLFGGAVAAWPIAARAEQPSRIWRVGYLSPAPKIGSASVSFDAFRLRLQELGYIEGRNLILDVRRADGDYAQLPRLAAELVALRPDVIVSSPAVRARTTAELIADEMGFERSGIRLLEPLYNASSEALFDEVVRQDDAFGCMMMVAHNPGLADLAHRFDPATRDNNLSANDGCRFTCR